MAIQLQIVLEARNPQRNCQRSWQLSLGQDLLGDWTICTRFGRIGHAGRALMHVFAAEAEALAHVRHALRRRAGAPRRIGTVYRCVAADPAALPLLRAAGLGDQNLD